MNHLFIILSMLASITMSDKLSCPCETFRYGEKKADVAGIYCISHGSIAIRVSKDFSIFIDPVEEFDLAGGKTVLLTHEHPDHFNRETIASLAETAKPGPFSIYGNRKCIEQLGEGVVLENGEAVELDCNSGKQKLKITAVPAYNTTADRLRFHPKGNGNGYMIEIGNLVIYVAGDTEVIPEMSGFGKVDIAFLPVNQPYTMTAEQCIEAARIIKPGVLIPYHMGDTDMTPVISALENSGIKVIFHEELR